MNLIDKYIVEVGKHLPRKNRADIEAEIRSTLEDMLEERGQGKGPAEEAAVLALLKEYGSPREVAAKYKTHQYLIGPRLFPLFEMVVKIVFAVLAAVSLIGLGLNLSQTGLSGPEFISALGKWLGGLFTGLIAAFGNITIVFAILERTKAANEFEKEFGDWDPKELQGEPDPDQVDRADQIGTIIFTTLALVVLNLYPNLLSIGYLDDGTWVSMPLMTPAFFAYLPWINLIGLVQIVFSSFMLGQAYWKPLTRILDILVDLAGLFVAVTILRTPGIFNITPETLAGIGITDGAEELTQLLSFVPTIVLIVIVVVTAISVIRHLIRLFAGTSRSPYPVTK